MSSVNHKTQLASCINNVFLSELFCRSFHRGLTQTSQDSDHIVKTSTPSQNINKYFFVFFLKIKNCFGILKLSGRWQANKDKCYSYGLVGWAVGSLPATENDDWNKFLFKKKFWYFAGSILVLLNLCQHQIKISIIVIFTLLTMVVGRSVDYLQTSSSTFWRISRLAQQGEVLLKLSISEHSEIWVAFHFWISL